VTGPRTLEARYTYIGKLITISTNQPKRVTVDPSGDRIEGKSVTIKTATTNDTLRFDGWFENGTLVHSTPNYPFVVTGPRTLEARYTYIGKMITISTNQPKRVTVDPSGDRIEGKSVTIKTATTNDTLRFDGWFENGTLVHSTSSYPFVVTVPRTLEARYTYIGQKITITANRTSQVTKTESGDGILGKTTTVTTSASNSLLVFDGWYEGNTKVYSSQTYPFTVAGPRTLEARYNIDGVEGQHCIPDVNFRNYITSTLGINIGQDTYTDAGKTYYGPNAATKTAMSQKTEINMQYFGSSTSNLKVSNTEGIQYFTGLTTLAMDGSDAFDVQNYPSIDLSKNTNLVMIHLRFGSLSDMSKVKLPKAGRVTRLYLYANLIPANTFDGRHDLRGVMNPSNGASNEVYVGIQGSRSTSNANAFHFRLNANELTQSRWTQLGGSTIDSDVAGTSYNAGARLWNK
ncbi:MAG: InlB B-repeat-containing protein, partial [Phocaeicola sp.]